MNKRVDFNTATFLQLLRVKYMGVLDKFKALFQKKQKPSEAKVSRATDEAKPAAEPKPVSKPVAREEAPKKVPEKKPEPVVEEVKPVASAPEEKKVSKGKKSADKASKGKAAESAKPASKGYGSTPLGKSLNFAEAKLMAKQDKISKAEFAMFKSKIAACAEKVGKDEEAALVSASQIIGGIIRA